MNGQKREMIRCGLERWLRTIRTMPAHRVRMPQDAANDKRQAGLLIETAVVIAEPKTQPLQGTLISEAAHAIERALERLDVGQYGICESCLDRIPEARLDAAPFVTRCIACQLLWESVNLPSAPGAC